MSLFDFYEINLFKHLLCSKCYASPNLNHGISQDLNFQDLCSGHVANIFFCHRKSKQTRPRKWIKFMENVKNFLLSLKVQQNVSKLSSCKFCLCTNIFIICLLFVFYTIYLLFHCVSQSLSIIYHYLQNKAFHISCFSDMSWVSCTKHSQNFAKSLKNTPVNEFILSKFKFKSTKKELFVRLFLRIFLKY